MCEVQVVLADRSDAAADDPDGDFVSLERLEAVGRSTNPARRL